MSDICCDGFDGVDGADVCVVIDDCCGGGWGGRTDVGACVMSGEGSMAGRTAGCCREDGPFSVKVLGDTSGQLDELKYKLSTFRIECQAFATLGVFFSRAKEILANYFPCNF